MSKPLILMILPRKLFPLVSGYSLKNYNLIKILSAQYAVDLCLLTNEELTKGVKVSMAPNKKIHIEVYVILEFGIRIETVAENLIDTIKYNVEKETGLKVGKVTVNVQSVRV